jgi:hypothetical protein
MRRLAELDTFVTEHHRCGDLDAGTGRRSCGWRASAEPASSGERTSTTMSAKSRAAP